MVRFENLVRFTVSLKIKGALKYRAQAIFGFVCNLIGGRRAFAVK